MKTYESWGRYPSARQDIRFIYWTSENLEIYPEDKSILPYGCGRSYGDSCLNDGGVLIDTTGMNRFIWFDTSKGLLKAEAGVTLAEILDIIVPAGWFLPVTPGTKFVTLGGAIANDVHGKNHHNSGAFGCHVVEIELLRSDGMRLRCSPTDEASWFEATVGGLGLTGLILTAVIKLKPIVSPLIRVESTRFLHIRDFFEISSDSDPRYEYTVAWIDCLGKDRYFGRGIYFRGEHLQDSIVSGSLSPKKPLINIHYHLPSFLLNYHSIKAFNSLYYHRAPKEIKTRLVHHSSFFYPLDIIDNWNRLYGKRGFLQYQCVVPDDEGGKAITKILRIISDSRCGSFLGVLKRFGNFRPVGMLSFSRKGVTLALDFPNSGKKVFDLFERLDNLVREYGGALYPAKDARMSKESFNTFFTRLPEFLKYKDPQFSSSFWRRVNIQDEIGTEK